jgi:hypothetical protein
LQRSSRALLEASVFENSSKRPPMLSPRCTVASSETLILTPLMSNSGKLIGIVRHSSLDKPSLFEDLWKLSIASTLSAESFLTQSEASPFAPRVVCESIAVRRIC